MGIMNYLKTINDEISKVRIEILQNKDTEITERHLYDVEQRVFKLMDIVEREESGSNESAALPLHDVGGSYSIDFSGHCKAKIEITNGEPKVEAAMNGWGEGISLSDIIIEKL